MNELQRLEAILNKLAHQQDKQNKDVIIFLSSIIDNQKQFESQQQPKSKRQILKRIWLDFISLFIF